MGPFFLLLVLGCALLSGPQMGDGTLEAGFKKEKGRPTRRVPEEVRCQAAVEGRQGTVGAGERADEGDGCWRGRPGACRGGRSRR